MMLMSSLIRSLKPARGGVHMGAAIAGAVLVLAVGWLIFGGSGEETAGDAGPVIIAPHDGAAPPVPDIFTIDDVDPASITRETYERLNASLPRRINDYASIVEYRRTAQPGIIAEVMAVARDDVFLVRHRLHRSLPEADRALCKDDPQVLASRLPQRSILVDRLGIEYGSLEHWMMFCPNIDITRFISL